MSKVMTLPKIGVNMTEAVIGQWIVKIGDAVAEGDEIMSAETDKSTQSIYATESGIVGELLFNEGDTVQVNAPILVLLEEGERISQSKQKTEDRKERIWSSPLARKLAKQYGIDLKVLSDQKSGSRIVKRDVEAFREKLQNEPNNIATSSQTVTIPQIERVISDANSPQGTESVPLSGVRKTIAERMSQSASEKPSVLLTVTVNTDELMALRKRYKERGINAGYNEFLARIVAQVLTKHKRLNAWFINSEIQISEDINIGIAVATDDGLFVPVIRNADRKNIAQITKEFSEKRELIEKQTLRAQDISGGTFTITNLGMYGIEMFSPIINPPECAILGVGTIRQVFVPDANCTPTLTNLMTLSLVFDHRIVDGAPAAKFLQELKKYIEYPELLI
jgi:pyruvate dehydrogenase E2 component (dihydrolipoamide acetyltransferase)